MDVSDTLIFFSIFLQLGAIVLVVCHFPFFLSIFPFPTLYAAARCLLSMHRTWRCYRRWRLDAGCHMRLWYLRWPEMDRLSMESKLTFPAPGL